MPTNNCIECSGDLEKVNESHSLNLYAHTDEWHQCQDCGEIYTHGIPDVHEMGMSFYNAESKERFMPPDPCCEQELQPTKIWPSESSVQFKCPVCYRVETVAPEGDESVS